MLAATFLERKEDTWLCLKIMSMKHAQNNRAILLCFSPKIQADYSWKCLDQQHKWEWLTELQCMMIKQEMWGDRNTGKCIREGKVTDELLVSKMYGPQMTK